MNNDVKQLLQATAGAAGVIAALFGIAIFFAALGDLIY